MFRNNVVKFHRLIHGAGLVGLFVVATLGAVLAQAGVDEQVAKAEADRVAVVAKLRPAVLAVCQYGGMGNGSGVIIDPEGYALTNYHVTDGLSPVMHSGMADGQLYETVIVGQDIIGDVSLIKLLPREPGKPFPYVPLGDSDKVRAGDWSLAMGNPFSLAMDFTPTVTYGLVSGVNRYQPPAGGGTLEYTDCIQMDTSINPGNSGGPLFNMKGELIGINGRGSFEKRGRVNSGVGYAISINQIKNFLGHFRAGIDTDHATLGALVETIAEDGNLSKILIKQILEESDAARRGLTTGDQLVEFAGRPMTSTNHYKNILGIFPREWRVPVSYRRERQELKEVLVRLMGNKDTALKRETEPKGPKPKGPPQNRPDPNKERSTKSPAMKLFEEKAGYANFYFNKSETNRTWNKFRQLGDWQGTPGDWTAKGTFDCNQRKG
ncbi:MAG: S1C family serine protease, partial [Gemmataceae bacterium]